MTLARRSVLLLAVLVAFSAFAQSEILVVDHGSPIEAAATGTSSMLAVFTTRAKLAPCTCGEVDAVRVGFDGNPIGTPFRVASSFALQTQPAVAFDGVRFLTVWNELADPPLIDTPKPSRVVGAFVSEDGSRSVPFVIANAMVNRPVIVWDRTRYVVFFSDLDGHAMGVFVTDQGVAGAPFATGTDGQITSAAASGSQIAFVSIRANKAEATILGEFSEGLADDDVYEARIAWNGRTFLAVWTQSDGIYARMFGGKTHLVAADSNYPWKLQLIGSGSLFFAAWEGSAMSTAWIDSERFSVMATVDSGYAKLTLDPHEPVPVDVPGETVALFHTKHFFLSQFTGFINDYVSFVKPGRQRTMRR